MVAGVLGMTLAVVGTLLYPEVVYFEWIAITVVVGTIIGVPLSHAFGGPAAGLVGTAKYSL